MQLAWSLTSPRDAEIEGSLNNVDNTFKFAFKVKMSSGRQPDSQEEMTALVL